MPLKKRSERNYRPWGNPLLYYCIVEYGSEGVRILIVPRRTLDNV